MNITATCLFCGAPFQQPGKGRHAVFCSNAHKQAHYRQNVTLRNAQPQPPQNVTLRNEPKPFDVYQAMATVGIDLQDFDSRPKEYQVHFIAQLIRRTIPHNILLHAFIYSLQGEETKTVQPVTVGVCP